MDVGDLGKTARTKSVQYNYETKETTDVVIVREYSSRVVRKHRIILY